MPRGSHPERLVIVDDLPKTEFGKHNKATVKQMLAELDTNEASPVSAAVCQSRVVIVTGAATGIGREHALEFARQGAKVVVNDVASPDVVVKEITDIGGEAIGFQGDVSEWETAELLVKAAVDQFGELHAVVNNAGILRDKMLVTMSPDHWDAVIKVHLRGTFCVTRHAASYWRQQDKAGTPTTHPRVVNTSSPSGLFGNVGQSNYGAAKAGIAAFTIIAADELGRLGVGVNAVAPTALTGMTAGARQTMCRPSASSPNTPASTSGHRPTSPRWSSGWPARTARASPGGCSRSRAARSASQRPGSRGPPWSSGADGTRGTR